MDKIEQQMIERFIEMRKQADRTRDEADKMDEAAADVGYLATLQYPDFLDHVSEVSKEKGNDDFLNSPYMLIKYLLTQRGFFMSGMDRRQEERKPTETTRHWLQRCEKIIAKKQEARRQVLTTTPRPSPRPR